VYPISPGSQKNTDLSKDNGTLPDWGCVEASPGLWVGLAANRNTFCRHVFGMISGFSVIINQLNEDEKLSTALRVEPLARCSLA
jgi:hypothetical protein